MRGKRTSLTASSYSICPYFHSDGMLVGPVERLARDPRYVDLKTYLVALDFGARAGITGSSELARLLLAGSIGGHDGIWRKGWPSINWRRRGLLVE